jgi:hypothetical protein
VAAGTGQISLGMWVRQMPGRWAGKLRAGRVPERLGPGRARRRPPVGISVFGPRTVLMLSLAMIVEQRCGPGRGPPISAGSGSGRILVKIDLLRGTEAQCTGTAVLLQEDREGRRHIDHRSTLLRRRQHRSDLRLMGVDELTITLHDRNQVWLTGPAGSAKVFFRNPCTPEQAELLVLPSALRT